MILWSLFIFICCSIWAWVMGSATIPAWVGEPLSFKAGYILPMASMVFVPSGIISAIMLAVTKDRLQAMMVMTVVAAITIGVLSLGRSV